LLHDSFYSFNTDFCCAHCLQEALARQARPSAASLGLEDEPYSDPEADLDTLNVRMEYALEVLNAVSGTGILQNLLQDSCYSQVLRGCW
jgi:hypothetical protein